MIQFFASASGTTTVNRAIWRAKPSSRSMTEAPAGCSREETLGSVLWDTSTGEELAALQHSDRLSWATYSRDGRWLATGTTAGTVTLWDAATHERYLAQGAHSGRAPVRFSSDDSLLVSIGIEDGLIKVWDVQKRSSKRAATEAFGSASLWAV